MILALPPLGPGKHPDIRSILQDAPHGPHPPLRTRGARDLLRIQLVGQAAAHGAAGPGSFATKATIIVSRDGYILDGHHRFGQVMLAGPSTKMTSLVIPMGINDLLKMGTTYAAAIGNRPKA